VQHWWHPPSSRGVRTRISDDYLWLPWVATNYVDAIGDTEIWQTRQPFLSGRELNPDEESYYDYADTTTQSASLYQHCKRAIEHGLRFGPNGLPLIGSGDWNDGMNRVGEAGRGESVWLGFFLCDVLRRFAPHARACGDEAFAVRLDRERETLAGRLDEAGWDGAWYRRAYTDDGVALGSAQRQECRIDSIPQSWSVLSGAADPERARQAVDSALEHLVRESDALVQLFDPPFDKTEIDPGYIKGYVPGVRENGGQYTHAAVWLVIALAQLGRAEDAWRIFDLINPVQHGDDAERMDVYKVEPYVVAADVYWLEQHRGRGGWTWYTGSAGWMYRLLGEYLLGVRREGAYLKIAPCVPAAWPGYRVDYRFGTGSYAITVTRDGPGNAVQTLLLDGEPQPQARFKLHDDGREHSVQVHLGDHASGQPG
jgi:cellobiose phosphorylase